MVNELPTNVVLFEKFPVVLIIILAVKTLPSLFLQLNLIVKLNWFIKEHEFKEAFKLEELENWRVKFGKVKFSGKTIWSNFRHKMFKRTSLPRSIWSCKSLNLIGSSNFVLHFRELQFDVGDGRSGFEINKIKLLLFCFDPLLKTWQDLLLICYILIESCVYLVANLK